jgi:hypothetical protein
MPRMSTLGQVSCAHHPDRRGFALCVSCRKVVCQECATPFEGKNLCRPCLLAREQAKNQEEGPAISIALAAVGMVLCAAAAWAMAWGSALFARQW